MSRLIELLQSFIGAHFNVKVSSYRKFQELLFENSRRIEENRELSLKLAQSSQNLEHASAELNRMTRELTLVSNESARVTEEWARASAEARKVGQELASLSAQRAAEVAQLAAEVAQLEGGNQKLQEDLSAAQFLLRQARNDLSTFAERNAKLQLSLSGKLGPAISEQKEIVVIVMTTISQFLQLKALVTNEPFERKYDFLVIAYIDIPPELVEFCLRTKTTLLNYQFQLIVKEGNPFLASVASSLNRDLETSFGKDAPFENYPVEHRHALYCVTDILSEVQLFASTEHRCHELLFKSGAALLVMFEDNAGYYATGTWAAVARRDSVPTVILPFTIADRLEALEAHYQDRRFWADEGIYNRLTKSLMPGWVGVYRDRSLVRRIGISALSAEATGNAPSDPWVLNGNKGSVIAVESPAMYDHYLKQCKGHTRVSATWCRDQKHASRMISDA